MLLPIPTSVRRLLPARVRQLVAAVLLVIAPFQSEAASSRREGYEARKARVDAACVLAGKPAYPAADRPGDEEARALGAGCDSEALYYGIGRAADPAGARRCAFIALRKDEHAQAGSAMLMMLYANGRGVARDLDLAIAIACGLEAAGAERVGRVEHLLNMKAGRDAGVFDTCDDITSGYMAGYCVGLRERSEAVARGRRLDAAVARLPIEARPAFEKLKAAADAFFAAREDNEVDLSGTARAALVIEEGARLREAFASSVEALLAGPPTWRFDAEEYAAADRKLNEAYREAIGSEPLGTVTPDGIRKTQRAWLPYRDAWADFGRALHPGVPAVGWKAWITKERTQMLAE
jgi:hypothetical protein